MSILERDFAVNTNPITPVMGWAFAVAFLVEWAVIKAELLEGHWKEFLMSLKALLVLTSWEETVTVWPDNIWGYISGCMCIREHCIHM